MSAIFLRCWSAYFWFSLWCVYEYINSSIFSSADGLKLDELKRGCAALWHWKLCGDIKPSIQYRWEIGLPDTLFFSGIFFFWNLKVACKCSGFFPSFLALSRQREPLVEHIAYTLKGKQIFHKREAYLRWNINFARLRQGLWIPQSLGECEASPHNGPTGNKYQRDRIPQHSRQTAVLAVVLLACVVTNLFVHVDKHRNSNQTHVF